jgi:hypothetical protein
MLRGGAVGNGPCQQMIGDCINEMFKDMSIFRKLSDAVSGYYGPAISDFTSASRAHELRVAGFLTLLHLCWTGLLPLRISPCVILATFLGNGLAGVYSPNFLEHVLPETALRLKLWDDHVASSPLFTIPVLQNRDTAALQSLIINHLGLQICLSTPG